MSVLVDLADAMGSDAASHLLTDADLTAPYGTDWTRRWSARPRAVLRPADTAAVARVLQVCAGHGVPVVPQGGNTGLVGGSVPGRDGDSVVLSLTRLDHLGPVDRGDRAVTVAAGVTLASLQRRAREAGLVYGVDLAARDTATVGGTVATNAGGLRVCRYGDTRAQVVGLTAVLADGTVIDRLHRLPKDGAGYDLPALLIGSEGTLAVITEVRLRLHEPDPPGVTTLIGCTSLADAVRLLPRRDLRMAEVMTRPGVDVVCSVTGLPKPLNRPWPVYLLIETPDLPDLPEDVEAVVDDRVVAYRERHPDAIATLGVVHKYDIALPLTILDPVLEEIAAALSGHQLFVYGHIAEGNLHLGVVGPPPEDEQIDAAVLAIVARHGGSIASEHGVGRAKAALLPLHREPGDIAAMRAIKAALDPTGLLNPGVVLA